MNQNTLISILGAVGGAALGYGVFTWLASSGAYGFAIPGLAVGLGASLRFGIAGWVSVFSGLLGLGIGVFATWKHLPFLADPSFGYFLGHLHQLPGTQQLLLAVGALAAFWLPFRRRVRNGGDQETTPGA